MPALDSFGRHPIVILASNSQGIQGDVSSTMDEGTGLSSRHNTPQEIEQPVGLGQTGGQGCYLCHFLG